MNSFYTNIDKIQLLFIFVNSFLLSRLLIVTKIPERLVLYLIGKKHLSIIQIVLSLIFASAFLSFLIPNVITVFTLLPVIKILSNTFEESLPHRYREIETLLPLTLIYGANIGGMGSITGTPANGIMVLYATLYQLPGIEHLSFEVWLLWGIPMVVVFILTSWIVLTVSFRLWNYHNELVHVAFPEVEAFHPLQHAAIKITVLFFLLSVLFSILMKTSSEKFIILTLTALATFVLIFLLFFMPVRKDEKEIPRRFLTLQDCYSNLPWRGLFFVGMIIVLIGIGALFHVQDYIVAFFDSIVRQNLPLSTFYIVIAALTSFSTELFSNTVVQIAMFSVIKPLFGSSSVMTIQVFLIITLSCTSAFMTPIATGVNALAFGEMKGISFAKMLTTGLIMKLIGVFIIAFGVPRLFGWLL